MSTSKSPTRTAVRMQVNAPGSPLQATRVEAPSPAAGWVRIAVAASGVCYADIGTASADRATKFPIVPGHEIAGTIAETGAGVNGWTVGERVAVGWFGGSCGHCQFCRRSDVVHCPERRVPGVSYLGGWAESVTVPADALVRIPDGLDFAEAAPMGCAGVTTFNAIRFAGLRAGARVAVFGVGGLGHLAVQFSAALGYETVAVARDPERETLARALGAHIYLDSTAAMPGRALRELGGADLILCTASTTAPVAELIDGLAVHGRLSLIGIDGGTVEVPAARLTMNSQIITGHLTGSALDIEETMRFALAHGIRPMMERMPLENANEALARVKAATPRFRVVLDTTGSR